MSSLDDTTTEVYMSTTCPILCKRYAIIDWIVSQEKRYLPQKSQWPLDILNDDKKNLRNLNDHKIKVVNDHVRK